MYRNAQLNCEQAEVYLQGAAPPHLFRRAPNERHRTNLYCGNTLHISRKIVKSIERLSYVILSFHRM